MPSRPELEKLENVRRTFTATFERFGSKSGYMCMENTILLKDIFDVFGNYIADHIWLKCVQGFERLDLKEGDKISFRARVVAYHKGYFGRREDVYKPIKKDYKLKHPTKIKKIIEEK